MAFKKGKPKTGGREKGVENKITQDARERFIEIMEGEVDSVKESLAQVRKEDHGTYLKILAQLLPYFLPKKTDVTSNGKGLHDKPIIIDWNGGSDQDSTI